MAYHFGEFNLDIEARQLYESTDEIHLSPKAFDLLHALIENHPRAVAKQQLQERLWPTTFVSEANLPTLVAEIRAALHDRPRQSRFVRTVHRYGYAFCGEVVDVSASGSSPIVPRHWLTVGSRRFVLTDGLNVIGRDPASSVWLDSASVSRRHATIQIAPGHVLLEDSGSKNGTFVGGQRISDIELRDGDRVRVGQISLTFRTVSTLDPTRTREVRRHTRNSRG